MKKQEQVPVFLLGINSCDGDFSGVAGSSVPQPFCKEKKQDNVTAERHKRTDAPNRNTTPPHAQMKKTGTQLL